MCFCKFYDIHPEEQNITIFREFDFQTIQVLIAYNPILKPQDNNFWLQSTAIRRFQAAGGRRASRKKIS